MKIFYSIIFLVVFYAESFTQCNCIPLPNTATYSITIYNVTGKEVEIPVNFSLNAGVFEVSWDGSNYPSGVYYYTIRANNEDFTETKKDGFSQIIR